PHSLILGGSEDGIVQNPAAVTCSAIQGPLGMVEWSMNLLANMPRLVAARAGELPCDENIRTIQPLHANGYCRVKGRYPSEVHAVVMRGLAHAYSTGGASLIAATLPFRS